MQSYDEHYQQAIAKLDSIDYHKVVDEVSRQYQEWAENKEIPHTPTGHCHSHGSPGGLPKSGGQSACGV